METGSGATEPVVVLVMGMTGAGKSTFVSQIIGDDCGIGHELASYTKNVGFHIIERHGKVVYLVDTPGFNDTWQSDNAILSEIAFILGQIYRQGLKLAGILYMHRISDNRITGSALKNLNMLEHIIGPDATSRLFLISTMWNLSGENLDECLLREKELKSKRDFWGRFSQKGSEIKRWRGDKASAFSIVDCLMNQNMSKAHRPLLIQKELIDEQSTLQDTAAGQTIFEEYTIAENISLQELQSLQTRRSTSDQQRMLAEYRQEIEHMRQAKRQLRISMQSLLAERQSAYREVLSQIQDSQQHLALEIEEEQQRFQRFQDDAKANKHLLEEEQYHWRIRRAKLTKDASAHRRTKQSIDLEKQKIAEEEKVFTENLEELQQENEENISVATEKMRKLRKRDVLKRNILPLICILAGVGMGVAGGITAIFPLVGVGIGVAANSALKLNISRKQDKQKPLKYGSFLSSSVQAADNILS